MKRLLSIGLALSLLGSSAAMARDYGHDYWHGSYGHLEPSRNGYEYRDNNGTAAAVGFGILALGLFGALAAQDNSHYDYGQGYYAPPPNRGYGNYGYGSDAPTYGYGGGAYRYGR